MFDLHCHSYRSDGEWSPAAVVARARERGVRVLALTDHDTTDGYEEAAAAAGEALRVLPAVEISCSWSGKEIHIVGLDVDRAQPAFAGALRQQQARRWTRMQGMADKLARDGIADVMSEIRALPAVSPGRQHLARLLVARGHVRDAERAFARYVGRKGSAYVPAEWCTLDEAVGWIVAAGGLAVLAHPGRYDLSGGALLKLMTAFRDAGGVAIELSYPQLFIEEAQRLAGQARKLGLLASQGSDFHSPAQHWTDLGRTPPLPPDIAPVWSLRPHWLPAADAGLAGGSAVA